VLTFHAIVHADPPGAPFNVTFEDVSAALATFERLYIEPDGSFVWASSSGEPAWQLDGVLYDRDGRLQHIDLKGACPAAALDRLLAVLGWPATRVQFELVREGETLDETAFRRRFTP